MKIAIIGCGYLGYAISKELYNKGHFVTCATTNPESIKKLDKVTNKTLIMSGNDEKEMSIILNNNDVIIVTVSTNSNSDFENTYLQTAKTIKKCAIEIGATKTIICTSKSSIYGDHQGMWVDESSELRAQDEKSKILIEIENTLFSLKDLGWKICILRLAQVYGPQREIIDLFKSIYKPVLPGHGDYYINMIHQSDVVGIITYVLEREIQGIFNAVDDEHLTRKEFAEIICAKLKLQIPTYDSKLADFPDNNKRVSNYRIKEIGYVFKYPQKKY